jgi:hypothetical protein
MRAGPAVVGSAPAGAALLVAAALPVGAAVAMGAAPVLVLGFGAAAFPVDFSGVVACADADSAICWTAGRLWLRRWGRLRGSPPRTWDGRGSVIALR